MFIDYWDRFGNILETKCTLKGLWKKHRVLELKMTFLERTGGRVFSIAKCKCNSNLLEAAFRQPAMPFGSPAGVVI